MFSDHPSSPRYRPSEHTVRAWSLYVYLVADRATQQRILRAILSLGRAGVTALGTQRGTDHFVIIDYATDADKIHAKHVVLSIDPYATITFSGRKHQIRTVSS